MTKKQILRIADLAYSEERAVEMSISEGAACGDTLALFIARELSDVYDRKAGTRGQIEEARRAMHAAEIELGRVVGALEDALHAAGDGRWSEFHASPKYPVKDWRYEVANGDTERGYHEWVESCLERDKDENE